MPSRHFVIVENPGTSREAIARDGMSFVQAAKHLKKAYTADELENGFAQIMRQNDDGTLSTEY